MVQRPVVAHAIMVTGGTGRVVAVSLAFDGSSAAAAAAAFRQRLSAALATSRRTFGGITVRFRGGEDSWYIVFSNGCDESTLGSVLRIVANSMKISIFIDPGIPMQDLAANLLRFSPIVDLRRDRPSN